MRQTIDGLGTGAWRQIVEHCLRKIGHTFDHCELCGVTDKKLDIHHTKYDGATIYDLQVVCHKCNTQEVNRYLA